MRWTSTTKSLIFPWYVVFISAVWFINLAASDGIPLFSYNPDNLTLTNTNGNYSLYIGSFSGSNGMVHMNYDNFILCSGQEESSDLEARLTALENKVDELEDRINLLDTMINRIKSYFFFSPLSVRKAILCDSLEKSNETEITEWDLTCKIQSKNSRERCVCNKLK